MPAGPKLKSLRNKRNITVREVEQASRRIADAKGDKRFCISNGWLAQLENGASEPSICKLFSLSVIYRANFLDLVRLYNVDVDETEKYETVANPYLTQLISHRRDGDDELWSQTSTQNEHAATTLMPEVVMVDPAQAAVDGNRAPHIIYGHLGLADFTMYPMIRPNALLRIDTRENKLRAGAWHNEYERPIFFIELRDAYACGWCELHGNQLLIIPHQASPASVRRFMYPREAEIVGRVVGYSTNSVDLESESVNAPKPKLMTARNDSR